MDSETFVAVVTGAHRGIGFGIVKSLYENLNLNQGNGIVYLTSIDNASIQEPVPELERLGLKPKFHVLDITSDESVKNFRDFILETHGNCGIDILVNNAAIVFKPDSSVPFAVQAEQTIRVNYFGTFRVCQNLFPLLKKGARVVHVNSNRGHLSEIRGQEPESGNLRRQFADSELTADQIEEMLMSFVKLAEKGTHGSAGWPTERLPPYIVSKVGICALTRIQQKQFDIERPEDDIVVNSVHPGCVDTFITSNWCNDLPGIFTIEQGAEAPVWCALLPHNVKCPRGGYVWFDKQIVDWVNGPVPPGNAVSPP